MAANFMVFADVVEAEDYDLWVGDEGWDLDYYLHENPELKRAPYVFITDFIGVLPMRDDPSSTEFRRAWEKNAENIDHLRLHPDVRDLSIMVGDEADVLDREFGPELPNMRQWAREHFQFSGYTYHFDPAAYRGPGGAAATAGLPRRRARDPGLGRRHPGRAPPAPQVRRGVRRASPAQLPDTRMVLVAGPRLDPGELPGAPADRGAAVRPRPLRAPRRGRPGHRAGRPHHHDGAGRLPDAVPLLPAAQPLRAAHFVARRLDRLGAGVRMDYDRTTAEALGAAIVDHLGKPVRYATCRPAGPRAPRE